MHRALGDGNSAIVEKLSLHKQQLRSSVRLQGLSSHSYVKFTDCTVDACHKLGRSHRVQGNVINTVCAVLHTTDVVNTVDAVFYTQQMWSTLSMLCSTHNRCGQHCRCCVLHTTDVVNTVCAVFYTQQM
ncbi:hypothetical protein ACOMHN_029451 [Nucella lapillus]